MIERITVSPEIVIDIIPGADPHLVMVVNDRAGGHLIRIDLNVVDPLIAGLEQARQLAMKLEAEG